LFCQIEGLCHIWENVIQQNRGAILAHCMGLGKTLQAIAAAVHLLTVIPLPNGHQVRRVLILVPAQVMQNWKRELRDWVDPKKVKVWIANRKDDLFLCQDVDKLKNMKLADFMSEGGSGILLMSLEMFRTRHAQHIQSVPEVAEPITDPILLKKIKEKKIRFVDSNFE
jgi:SNF2 family DNA or RNA helicase